MEMLPLKNPLGRPPKYTPKQLWEEFEKYVQWCKDNPLADEINTEYAKGYSNSRNIKPRRLSVEGFQVWCGCSDSWWANLDKSKRAAEFLRVKTAIKKYCETYQIEMASAGLANGNIISRLLGLADKHEVKMGESVTIVVKNEDEKKKIEDIAEVGV